MPPSAQHLIDRMKWASERGIAELTVTKGKHRITILREGVGNIAAPVPASPPPEIEAPTAGTVTAPLSGVCHLAPEAGGTPFVSPGQTVTAGQTLCLIEAMKVMTSVTAPAAGTITAILTDDGASVAAGAPLVRLA